MPALTIRPAKPWPRAAGWLVPGEDVGTPGANCTWLEYLIVRRSERDDGIMEVPWGSNRGTRIDAMATRAGSPLGSYWCGLWLGAVFADCGARVPSEYGATRAWQPFLKPSARVGSAILYGAPTPHHIELVTRVEVQGMPHGAWDPHRLLTRGGNRGYGGSNTNNGVACSQAPMLRGDVLGFIRPQPVEGWSLVTYAPAEFLLEHLEVLPAPWRGAALSKIAGLLKAAA